MTQIYGSTNEADRFERSCSIDVDEIDKKTSRLAIVALAALAFAAGALVRATNAGATNLAAVGTKKWTCVAPYVDTELYGPSSGPLSAAGLAIWSDWPRPHQMSETESYRFQAPSEQVMTATLKSIGTEPMTRVTAWAFSGSLGDLNGFAAVASPVGVEFQPCTGGSWSGPIVNKRSGLRGSSSPASAKYTAPNYSYGTCAEKSATATVFVGDKWYQSTYKVSICTAKC